MYFLVPILFIATITLYVYLKRKIKGHDFRLVNKLRPLLQILLLLSIEFLIPCISFILYSVLSLWVEESILLSIISGPAIGLMLITPFFIPIKVNNNNPSSELNFSIYLRSFRSDSIFAGAKEKSLSSLINNIYPIYEIGNPYETIKIFNRHISIYKTDEDWQDAVTKLKKDAKIIILKLDGTEGLFWEISSIKDYLYKVLFIANDKKSFDEFISILKTKSIDEYKGFPNPDTFPTIIWKQSNLWYYCNADEITYYINEHPWQEESVQAITNSMVVHTNFHTDAKTYIINRFPTFLRGNKNIIEKYPLWTQILFFIFPFYPHYIPIAYHTNLLLNTLINLYLFGGAFVYYLMLFLIAYNISPERGGFSIDNPNLRECLLTFIWLSPIYLLALINGPKSYRLCYPYLSQRKFLIKLKKNFILGLIIAAITVSVGFISKSHSDANREERKKELMTIMPDYEIRKEKHYCKEHIDSIFNDLVATYALTDQIFCNRCAENRGAFIMRIQIDFQHAIKDSLGTTDYYPMHRDSLKTDKWYRNIATEVISKSLKE